MKIIDLLNKIANGEEVPKKIKWQGQIYEYSNFERFYYQNGFSMYRDFYTEGNCLNDEIEIIEEPKKIEKLETYKEKEDEDYFANILKLSPNSEFEIDEALSTTIDKLNELIDEINNSKEK